MSFSGHAKSFRPNCSTSWLKHALRAVSHLVRQPNFMAWPTSVSKVYSVVLATEFCMQSRSANMKGKGSLPPSLVSCFQMLKAIIRAKPRREFPVISTFCPRFCAASDAALEQPFCGTGGFLIVWYEGEIELREAFVANIPSQIYALWSPGEKKIAQLELSQALYAPGQSSRQVQRTQRYLVHRQFSGLDGTHKRS